MSAQNAAATTRAHSGMYQQTAPHSLEAEVAVLGAALLSATAAGEVVEAVQAEDFYRPAHRTVYEAIADLFARGESVDPITLVDKLTRHGKLDDVGGASAIHDLIAGVPTAAHAAYYAGIVQDRAVRRRLIDAAGHLARLGYDGDEDLEVLVDRAEAAIYSATQRRTNSHYSNLAELLSPALLELEELAAADRQFAGLPTGLTELDRLLAGLQPQNLVVIAARPSVGKTALALALLEHVTVKLRRPALVFSLEMSRKELVQRLLASHARVDTARLRTGRLTDDDWGKLSNSLAPLSEAPLYLDDTPGLSLMEMRSRARRVKQRHGLELIVVDYLQLMQPNRRAENRQQEVAEASRGCKRLAKELEVPVVALSQLSRQPELRADKRPQLADLRDSGAVEQDADVVVFIYRDEVYNADSPHCGIAELHVAKHRNGPTGAVRVAFLAHLAKFASLARTTP